MASISAFKEKRRKVPLVKKAAAGKKKKRCARGVSRLRQVLEMDYRYV